MVQPVNAIKAKLNCFFESITKKASLAIALPGVEIALFMAQEIENQINK